MILYLLRHGRAARLDPNQPRALTARGKTEVALVAEHFKREGLQVNTLWHSPKTRAVQTAEIFLEVLGKKDVQVEEKKDLKPEGDAQAVLEAIAALKEGSLLVVSHLPLVGDLASLLGADSAGHHAFGFPTAGLAAFEGKGRSWKWLWSLNPSTLKG